MSIHSGLNAEEREVLSLFQTIGSRLNSNFATVSVKVGNPHELAEMAKGQFAVQLARQMFQQYIDPDDQIKMVSNETEVGGKTFVVQLAERLAPFRTDDGLFVEEEERGDVINKKLLKKIDRALQGSGGLWANVPTRSANENTVLDEIADTINHFVTSSVHRESLKEAFETALNTTSVEFSYIQDGLPIGILLAGEALILENQQQKSEFETFFNSRLQEIEKRYYEALVKVVFAAANMEMDVTNPSFDLLVEEVFNKRVALDNPRTEILKLLSNINIEAQAANNSISNYLEEINAPTDKREELSKHMITFLSELNLPLGDHFSNVRGFFSHAYLYAAQQLYNDDNASSNGPNQNLSATLLPGLDVEGIAPQYIKSAGALYYIYELGDRLGMFRMADMLILMWAQGRLDLDGSSEAGAILYEYYKQRDNRLSYEERGMTYRRVLNLGNADLLNTMVSNEDFTILWEQLLAEVVDYIQKSEHDQEFDNLVSPTSIYQTTRDLQYNLTQHMNSKLLQDTQELYTQLQQCVRMFSHQEIVVRLTGASHNNMWGVIENLSRQEFGITPNISASRTVAVEGNKIFQWIADFKGNPQASNQSQFDIRTSAFMSLLQAVEVYVLANKELDE